LELRSYVPALIALALAYWAAAAIGLQWSIVPGAATAVWPAAGIAFAGLMLGGVRLWPAIAIGRMLTYFTIASHPPLWTMLLITAGTTLGAVVPVLILKRFRLFDPALARMRDVFWMTLVASLLGAAISATIGAGALWLGGSAPGRISSVWLSWWFGFAVGVLVMTPLILTWSPKYIRSMSSRRWLHLALCLGTIALLSATLFVLPTTPFLRVWHIYPAFIWAAVAFQVRGVAAALVITSIAAIWGSAHGTGPLIFAELPAGEQVLLAQQFIAVTALTKLFLAAAIDERRNVEASARLAAIVSSSPDAMISISPEGGIASWNGGAQRLFGYPPEEAIGQSFTLIVPGDASEEHGAIFPRALAGEAIDVETVRLAKGGKPVNVAMTASQMRAPDGTVLGVAAVVRDITQRKRTERELHETRDRQRLLINELNHRVKNSLAIVQAIAQQSFKGANSSPEARAAFEGRLAALSAAHDLLTRENWETASISKVIEDAVAPYRGQKERFAIDGPDLRLPPKTAVSFALALHELATNAVKYGALSINEGRVEIRWKIEREVGVEQLRLVWREIGGPPVKAPEKRGFGTRLIERSLAAEFEGKVTIDFPPEGVVCTVLAPLPDDAQ
jgi:PAS domain S-box-containing protein